MQHVACMVLRQFDICHIYTHKVTEHKTSMYAHIDTRHMFQYSETVDYAVYILTVDFLWCILVTSISKKKVTRPSRNKVIHYSTRYELMEVRGLQSICLFRCYWSICASASQWVWFLLVKMRQKNSFIELKVCGSQEFLASNDVETTDKLIGLGE